MASFELTIRLLSDLCVSDGGVYNSALDTDVCQDLKGFPVIPGKRLKGCLRESALELVDWGENIDVDVLFGKKGDRQNAGLLRISDAELEEAKKYETEVDPSLPLYHRQHILNLFSYVRTQTSIDHTTGVAAENSLRTIRVVNKGLVFVSEVEIPEPHEVNNLMEQLDMICTNLTHMGNSRTRGLGEVSVTINQKDSDDRESRFVPEMEWQDDADLLEYVLYLNEPVICKSVAGQQERTCDYIEGSKILGLIAGRYRKKYGEEVVNLLNKGRICFSNAYISDGITRYEEVPAYIYSIKNQSETYINRLYDPENKAGEKNGEMRQLQQMKHCYTAVSADGTLTKRGVRTEKRYHHRRPEDKSIGRAIKDEQSGDSGFYQIASISSGQTFKGFVKGTTEQIKIVYELLCEDSICRLGYGNSTEYGKVSVRSVKACREREAEPVPAESERVIVTLLSPAIVYDERATYSLDTEHLAQEVLAALCQREQAAVPKPKIDYVIEQKYVKYTAVGGYNVTWGMRKPVIQSFDKGTSLLIRLIHPGETDYAYKTHMFLGERNAEGYGEFTVRAFEQKDDSEFAISREENEGANCADPVGQKLDLGDGKHMLAVRIASSLFKDYLRGHCVPEDDNNIDESYKATISNMMQMCRENETYEDIVNVVRKRFGEKGSAAKQRKMEIAERLLNKTKELSGKKIQEFESEYQVSNFQYGSDLQRDILACLLQQMKYSIRQKSYHESEGTFA